MIEVLSDYWKHRTEAFFYVDKHGKKKRSIALSHFNRKGIEIHFEDSSYAIFKHAFFLKSDNEVAVFTEHNGYHVFNEGCVLSIRLID